MADEKKDAERLARLKEAAARAAAKTDEAYAVRLAEHGIFMREGVWPAKAEEGGAGKPPMADAPRGCIVSPSAARRLEELRMDRHVTKTQFPEVIGISARAYLHFRKTGVIRISTLETIAKNLGMTTKDLTRDSV